MSVMVNLLTGEGKLKNMACLKFRTFCYSIPFVQFLRPRKYVKINTRFFIPVVTSSYHIIEWFNHSLSMLCLSHSCPQPPTREEICHGIMAYMLDCCLSISKFKLQLLYHIHFWTYTLQKVMNPIICQL